MNQKGDNKFSFSSRIKSFSFAFRGLHEILKNQYNFRIHLAVAVFVIIMGFIFKFNLAEWSVLILTIGSVLSLEAINTALEYFVDLVSPDYNELAGKIKDISAGAVLISAFIAIIIGGILFIPKIIEHIFK
ncbi:MAG: diacylglycerol kinase family protein [Bacteroidales bacterium]|nr:diacylglycerol kinase family protein [Bacteroidales bacterium]MDD4603765.1 diacylglycerol kinase family protein [Bacteroidales bacterium]